MIISDDFVIRDGTSGLKISIVKDKHQNCLRIEHISKPICDGVDYCFTKEGSFAGIGSGVKS